MVLVFLIPYHFSSLLSFPIFQNLIWPLLNVLQPVEHINFELQMLWKKKKKKKVLKRQYTCLFPCNICCIDYSSSRLILTNIFTERYSKVKIWMYNWYDYVFASYLVETFLLTFRFYWFDHISICKDLIWL